MADESSQPACQLRRRRSSGNPNLPLNLEVGYQVNEGGPSQGTPSPSCIRFAGSSGTRDPSSSSALIEFRKKQQSFDIQVIVEECEEEEIVIDSDDEGGAEGNEATPVAHRAITPTPIQDFAANVVYTEGPQVSDFLKVKALEQDCVTDVSDADSEGEQEG
ncbi:uncharacterized protein isoform X1 [Choristoneura fumiferana]|uniref:uncharacterized protein isoform X1 n=1 Tax=Choristoneura fumiferana TaxID=7141 RepID=UPI003D156896